MWSNQRKCLTLKKLWSKLYVFIGTTKKHGNTKPKKVKIVASELPLLPSMYSRILMQVTIGKYKASLVLVGRDHKAEVKFIWIELTECNDLLIAEARKAKEKWLKTLLLEGDALTVIQAIQDSSLNPQPSIEHMGPPTIEHVLIQRQQGKWRYGRTMLAL